MGVVVCEYQSVHKMTVMRSRSKCLLTIMLTVQLTMLAVFFLMQRQTTVVEHWNKESNIVPPTGGEYTGSIAHFAVASNTSAAADNRIKEWLPPIKTEVFQPIDNKEAWLYSAFFDHVAAQKGKPLVRAFGVIRKIFMVKVFCYLTSEDKTLTSTGVITELPGHFDFLDRPAFLECSVPLNMRPTHISVSLNATCQKPTNRMPILYPGPRIRNFTVCYSVLHNRFNKTNQLIESIEMNRILGAEHFLVYNYSISPEVSQILSRYQEDGLVTVLQWQIPTLQSHYYSQMTSLNDCSYRNRNTSRFVVVVDTDEIIVPRSHLNWMELIDSASPHEIDVSKFKNQSQQHNSITGCFTVKSSVFPITPTPNWNTISSQQFTDDEKKNITKHKILTLSQIVRQNYIYPVNDRCKYIARPEYVHISGVHYVVTFTSSNKCLLVEENLALLHHYRSSLVVKDLVNDTSILKFKQILYQNIMDQIHRFPNIFI